MNPFASTPTKPSVSPEEAAQFKTYFKSLTSTNLASVDSVVKFLSLSNLSQQQLSTVWELSGGLERRNGLVEEEFIIACKLVALFQNGVTARVESLSLKTPMPVFKGMGGLGELTPQKTGQQPSAFSGQTPALVPQRTGQQTPVLVPQRTGQQTPVLVPQRTGQSNQSDLSRSPSISHSMICSAEEKKRFSGFFEVSGPVDGFLSGQIAREIFMKSGLGNDVLGKVWGLVDKDGKGKFNVDQFVAAMWIITKVKMGGLSSVPDSMPVALWNSITGVPERLVSLPNSVASSPVLKTVPLSSTPQFSPYTADLSDADRTQYHAYFDSIDTAKKGILNGQDCFPVFLKSNLPQSELGQIWELVDTSKSGSINKGGFVAAMHLIKKRISGAPIPSNAQNNSMLMDFNTAVPFSPSLSTPTAAPKIPSDGDLLKGLTMSPPLSTAQPSSITNNILKPSAFAPMSLPSVSQTPLMNVLSLEAKEVAIREQQLTSRQSEVATLTQQLLDLKPSADDLKKKREQIDSDYKKANEQRSQLSIELIQLRAEYELDLETLKDRQEMLARDIHALQVASTELQQYKDAIALIKKENQSLQEKIDMQKSQVGDMQAQVSRYAEETAKLREANQKVFEESKSQQQQFDVLEKMVESGKDEYRIVKENLDLEGNRLEQEKKKFQALEQQVSVQAAINEREKLKMKEIEKERKEMEIKAKELMVTEARLKDALALQEKELDAATSAREHQEAAVKAAEARELLANAVPHSEVIIPASEPPPPLPSLSKKPTQSSKENIAEAMVKERSSPVLPEIGNQKTKNQQDSIELDNLLSGNKPKSNSHDEKRATASPQPDFESFFATPNQSSFPQESPKKTSAEDMKRAMEMAFANTTLKAAKDTPSLAGSSSTLKKAAFSTDQFTFDSSFSAPQPLKSGNTISIKKSTNFGNFDDAKFTGFKPPTKTSPQDLDSVFGGASIPAPTGFDNDPFAGPNGFVSANATTASSNFGNDPFGAADFGNTPFPAPSQITSSPKGNDTPEVKSITSMGFTREQAVNALEIQGQDVQKAINYLLESTAK